MHSACVLRQGCGTAAATCHIVELEVLSALLTPLLDCHTLHPIDQHHLTVLQRMPQTGVALLCFPCSCTTRATCASCASSACPGYAPPHQQQVMHRPHSMTQSPAAGAGAGRQRRPSRPHFAEDRERSRAAACRAQVAGRAVQSQQLRHRQRKGTQASRQGSRMGIAQIPLAGAHPSRPIKRCSPHSHIQQAMANLFTANTEALTLECCSWPGGPAERHHSSASRALTRFARRPTLMRTAWPRACGPAAGQRRWA